MCNWVHLPDKENALPSTCTKEGEPYCPEHKAEMDYIHSLDNDWKEIEATAKSREAAPLKPTFLRSLSNFHLVVRWQMIDNEEDSNAQWQEGQDGYE